MKKEEEIKIQVNTFNWGPCVTRFKIQDDFRKVLLDEAKKTEQDFSDRLAGQIAKERGYSDKQRDIIIPYLSPYLGIYDEAFQRYQNKRYEHGNPEYALTALWCNFQRQYEFNPPHDHDGKLSFVIYLSIPDKLKEENEAYKGKSCGPGGIQFMYGEGPRDAVTYMSYFPKEGDMFIFPAWLKHWVSPFNSDCVRVSVSGNVHDSAPLSQVRKGMLKNEDEEYLKELKENMRPTVFVALPCYDMMKVETCLSLLNLFNKFTMHKIPAEFRTAKSPYISHCRNLLTAGFLHSKKDFLLFVDADMQFGADSVFRMLAGNYDICCTPYRLKDATMKESYPVSFENYDNIEISAKGFVEITAGPTGLMMIKRSVFDKLKEDNPNLQIKFPEEKKKNINAEIMGAENTDENPSEDCLWNFFDTSFDNHLFKGEDIAFCELARKSKFKIHANIESTTIHHGPYGYKGKFRDALEKSNMMGDKDIEEYHNIGKAIKKNSKYNYLDATRIEEHGTRLYDVNGTRLPSVTTILGKTKDQQFIKDWKAKVGEKEADRIKNLSSNRGTAMHKFLEHYILGTGYDDLTRLGQEAKAMAEKVIEYGLTPVEEWYGSEVTLYYPGLYAGSTDLVCLHDGLETIVDFKQSNRPKKKEWVEDYYLQIAAYAMAHDYVHGSEIRQGVIMMCTPDLYYQEFRITDHELRSYKHKFLKRLDMYHDLIFDEKEKADVKIEARDFTRNK